MLVRNGYLSRFVYLNGIVNGTIRIFMREELFKMFTYWDSERAHGIKATAAIVKT